MLKSIRKTGFSMLDGVTAMLAILCAFELYSALTPHNYIAGPLPRIFANGAGTATGDTTFPSQVTLAAWTDVVVGRPLFDPSRRPPAAPAQASVEPVEIPRLSGIMITPTEKIAVFSPSMGAPVIVGVNSQFGPFVVQAITADSVTVKGPEGVMVLRSDFSYQGKSGKATPVNTMLLGGIDLSLVKVPLPNAATWPGPPSLQ